MILIVMIITGWENITTAGIPKRQGVGRIQQKRVLGVIQQILGPDGITVISEIAMNVIVIKVKWVGKLGQGSLVMY